MRRIKLFVACCMLIVASLPLLPGPGTLIIIDAIAVLEREFLWVRRVMDALQSIGAGNRESRPSVRDAAPLQRHV